MISTTNSLNGVSSFYNTIKKKNSESNSDFTLNATEKERTYSTVETNTYSPTNGSFTNVTTTSDTYNNIVYNNVISMSMQSPYGAMADDLGLISYNGVTYQYSSSDRYLCLGDMNEEDNILTIPLSSGDTLRINRNSIDDLAKSISMFPPKDQKRIMEAIHTDAKCRSKRNEMEEFENKVLNSLF
jgi:hypothetical protein